MALRGVRGVSRHKKLNAIQFEVFLIINTYVLKSHVLQIFKNIYLCMLPSCLFKFCLFESPMMIFLASRLHE